ncbi:MAG: glycosyltransferase family 2 protein [Armatimonadetes bacterium]|nr:glycosyltransferase family 2 protein [Armatimonadota bacterium]MDW8120929.1 glycosyltransferase family 2 protein [Armatimonadota bacterium]
MKVGVVIPAYNEAERLGEVLRPVTGCPLVRQVVVVDDGSTDETARVAKDFGVEVIQLLINRGKAAAVWVGIKRMKEPIILMLDADLKGLREDHIYDMSLPVAQREADMVLGVFRGGRLWTDLSHFFAPWVSGQRAFRRETLLELPDLSSLGYGLEAALNKLAKERGWKVKSVILRGVSHVMKEEKVGLLKGLTERGKMYWQVSKGWLVSLNGRSPTEGEDP